ncbi:MAG: TonB-dependent receptor, partial [Gammaproteobacteria bacterium]|nr:TonB-dependent receptor [Gammaproteobacteria bacterium]
AERGASVVNGYYQYSRSDSRFTVIDFPRLDHMYRALDAVIDPGTGAIVCRSTLSFPADGCVPANMFGPGAPSPAAIDYILEGDMWRDSMVEQHFAELSAQTELERGITGSPMMVAGGVSFRRERFDQAPGPADLVALQTHPAAQEGYRGLPSSFVSAGILQFAGVGETPIGGHFDVGEVFAETLVPLVRDRPLINAMDFNAAARYAHYSGSGGVFAWKAGLDWRVNDSVRFRVTRSRDTRAATLSERFDVAGSGATAYDPVLDATYSFSTISGGNPAVAPELGDTWTLGMVLQPATLPNLGLSIDWYDVRISDYITVLGIQRLINECYAGAQELCDRIERNPVSGNITWVQNLYLNLAAARVRGLDVEFTWQHALSLFGTGNESIRLRILSSLLDENSFTNVSTATRDDAGTTSLPRWTATGMLAYRNGPFELALTGRYIADRVQFRAPIAPSDQLDDNGVDSVFYTNLRLGYEFDLGDYGRHSLFFNVANLFDVDPPVVANWSDFFGASAFPPGLHDTLGRRFTLGLEFEF